MTAAAYDWLGPDCPNDAYAITLVRGRSLRSVMRVLDPRSELGTWTPGRAYGYYLDRFDRDPHVVQVQRRGPGVVILDVSGSPSDRLLARLSRRGTVSSFFTTVELDTYVTVARRGRVIRQLDSGRRGVDPFSPAWALNERLTLIHVSEAWLLCRHPT